MAPDFLQVKVDLEKCGETRGFQNQQQQNLLGNPVRDEGETKKEERGKRRNKKRGNTGIERGKRAGQRHEDRGQADLSSTPSTAQHAQGWARTL